MLKTNNVVICRQWIYLATCAIACSGLLSIIVIFLRLPFISSLILSSQNIFDNALVIHVNLSILVWMCSVISLLFIINLQNTNNWFNFLLILSIFSAFLIFVSAFFSDTEIIKSNYIPISQNKLFLFGLGLFIISTFINIILSYISNKHVSYFSIGQTGLIITFISSLLCFILAYRNMPPDLYYSNKNSFYEYLFWGGGHLLQFVFVQGMFLVYLIILDSNINLVLNKKTVILLLFTNVILSITGPLIYLIYPIDSIKLMEFFVWHMKIAGAIFICILIILVCFNIKTILSKENYLLHSFILFTYGCILGTLTIEGNIIIPAHYHGCIVGITIAFMNFIYWLLPKLGCKTIQNSVIKLQIYLYSLGHFLHITSLAWLGGYGTLRKVAALPNISSILSRICFIIGGTTSLIGGMLFVIIVLSSLLRR
ncbi:MAG: cbb3-type cytochrome c oxidase subunit I [Wolbachia endosymbiont of Menacanthus eurysternus]|nr:MAG: cbb3-type cytochrome c oxidase subunit I [Wolbachia endosymbiont of Menacanthus eurysternus]